MPTPFPVKPNFTLIDTSGQAVLFGGHDGGKLTYLFFGYTHCPDACPATMSYVTYALEPAARLRPQAGGGRLRHRRPARDKPEPVLRNWLNHYSRSFVGLTGTLRQIGDVEHQAGVPTAILPKKRGVARYQVEHSSVLFVYSPDDRAHVVYATGFKPQDYAHDLPILLKFR